jgi:hypothetical protein
LPGVALGEAWRWPAPGLVPLAAKLPDLPLLLGDLLLGP